jgi:hypothetical protein
LSEGQRTVQIVAIVVRTAKNFRFLSTRLFAVRQDCGSSKTSTEEKDMRFICVSTVGTKNRLPTEAEIISMQKFIAEGMKAGWLIECEGVHFGTTGIRVHKGVSGEITVTDGPFAEAKEVIGGYAILNAASKEEAVKHTRGFLEHVGQGVGQWTWEIYQLYEMPMEVGQ